MPGYKHGGQNRNVAQESYFSIFPSQEVNISSGANDSQYWYLSRSIVPTFSMEAGFFLKKTT